MNRRENFLSLVLLDALDDENELDVLRALEQVGVDPSFVPPKRGISPLHRTCQLNNDVFSFEMTCLFLESGANPNVRSNENKTPMHMAALLGRVDIVLLLLQHGALLDVVDNRGKTPLDNAEKGGHIRVIQVMHNHTQMLLLQKSMERLQKHHKPQSHTQQLPASSQLVGDTTEVGPSVGSSTPLPELKTLIDSDDSTVKPKRIFYNFDTTLVYYRNVKRRSDLPQLEGMDISVDEDFFDSCEENRTKLVVRVKVSGGSDGSSIPDSVNLLSPNMEDLNERTSSVFETLQGQELQSRASFIISPKNEESFFQLLERYEHRDDEYGVVFYQTKLPFNVGNFIANQRMQRKKRPFELDTTAINSSTNITVPPNSDTDAIFADKNTSCETPGPITKSTKRFQFKQLIQYQRATALVLETVSEEDTCNSVKAPYKSKFSVELQRTVRSSDAFQRFAKNIGNFEQKSMQFFASLQKRQLSGGYLKQSFLYMLIDPKISCNLPGESVFMPKFNVWRRFVKSIFYVGNGKTSRPYSYLYDAMKAHMTRMHNKQTCSDFIASVKQKSTSQSSESRKLDRILNIWANGNGVVCLHTFHNISPTEAHTREAAIIDALGLQHLTNIKRGEYYGPARTWTMRDKKHLGIAMLYNAMQIYLAEGELQLSPSDN